MNTTNTEKADAGNQNKSVLFMLIFGILFGLVAAWPMIKIIPTAFKAPAAWRQLMSKSEAHEELVGAYRGCRGKILAAGSVQECQLVVSDYAKLRGYESELPTVLNDIQLLSYAIVNGEL